MTKCKVLVTDYNFETLKYEKKILKDIGAEFYSAQCKTEEDVIKSARGMHGLLAQFAPITRRVIESLPELKVVGRYGIGYDIIDVEAATENGVCVVNVPEYCEEEVSDHAFSLLMTLARKVVPYNQDVKNGNWDYKIRRPLYRLQGKTVGLIGFGKIPRRLAEKMKPFDFKVLAYDPYADQKLAKEYEVELVEIDELMKESDFVSVHAPLTKETKHLIGKNELGIMKESAFIINTSRGPVIDEKALIKVLKDGQLAGAGLDVTVAEPVEKDNPLLGMDNVIITPHVAWYSRDSIIELKERTAQQVACVLQGKKPEHLVNEEVWK